MRIGFTTGSCAAAAAKAACYMLLSGREKKEITIETPKGIPFAARIVDIERSETCVTCAVIKDGGDDPDVTTGAHICAKVREVPDGLREITIDGGRGVGRVTMPGLDQAVGCAAINHVPREMIEKEVREVMDFFDTDASLKIVISVPEGEELAKKTFNPRLGIVGGISILGTTGVVEPMSTQALLDTIRVELRQKKALGYTYAAVSPGNYGLDFMREHFNYDLDKSVKCSNFIGDTIDMVRELGFRGMLLTGHIGKLIKVSGGAMNTHSAHGDRRMELLAEAAGLAGCDEVTMSRIRENVVTEEGVRILIEAGRLEATMNIAMERILFYLRERAGSDLSVECMMYSTGYGLLAESDGAEDMLALLKGMGPKPE